MEREKMSEICIKVISVNVQFSLISFFSLSHSLLFLFQPRSATMRQTFGDGLAGGGGGLSGDLPDGLSGSLQPLNVSTFLFDDHNHHHHIHPHLHHHHHLHHPTHGQILLQLKEEAGRIVQEEGGATAGSEHIYAVVNTADGPQRARVVRSRSASRESSSSLSSFITSSNRNSGLSGCGGSDQQNKQAPNIFDLIPPPPAYPPPLIQLQSATHNGIIASHPVNAGTGNNPSDGANQTSTWTRTSKNGLLREDAGDFRAIHGSEKRDSLVLNDEGTKKAFEPSSNLAPAFCQEQTGARDTSSSNVLPIAKKNKEAKKPKLPPKKASILLQQKDTSSNPSSKASTAAPPQDIVSWLPLLKKTSAVPPSDLAKPPSGIFMNEEPSCTSFASPKLAAKHNNALRLAAASSRTASASASATAAAVKHQPDVVNAEKPSETELNKQPLLS